MFRVVSAAAESVECVKGGSRGCSDWRSRRQLRVCEGRLTRIFRVAAALSLVCSEWRRRQCV